MSNDNPPMPDDLIRRTDAKAALAKIEIHGRVGSLRVAFEALDSVPAAGAGDERPRLLASMTSSNGSRDCWWHREGEDLWESQRIFGVASHAGSKDLAVDRTASDEAALKLYDADLTSRPAAKE